MTPDRFPHPPTETSARRALQQAGRELNRLQQAQDCAALLRGARQDEAARLLDLVVRLRRGFPSTVPSSPAPGEGATPVDLAVAEWRTLFALEAELAPLPEAAGWLAEPAAGAAEPAPPPDGPPFTFTLATWLEDLIAALGSPPGPGATRTVGELLARLRAEVAGRAPADLEDAGADIGVLGVRLAFNSLRDFLISTQDLAATPVGSPQVFHRLARCGEAALGPYLDHAHELVGGPRDLLALLQFARGAGAEAPEPPAALARWGLVLLQRASGRLRVELLDELADLGLAAAPWGALAAILRQGGEPDRELLQHVRDAGLDLGELDLAWRAQHLLAEHWPQDGNEWLALGDVSAYRGDYAHAQACFETALQLDPDNGHGRRCVETLQAGRGGEFRPNGGFGTPDWRKRLRGERRRGEGPGEDYAAERARLELARSEPPLVVELAPGEPPRRPADGLHLRRIGARRLRTARGELAALGGVEAVRGFYVSDGLVDEVDISLGGRRLARLVPEGFPLGDRDEDRRKFVFNAWVDVSAVAPGRYALEITLSALGERRHVHREAVLVTPPLCEAEHPGADAVVDSPAAGAGDLEEAVRSRASLVRAARRRFLDGPLRRILVLRTDQLGDLVCSIPALERLREIAPGAEVTGLVSHANAALARSLPVFDEVLAVDFPNDPALGRRVMPLADQAALKAELHGRGFDLAIDLADNSLSRYLLLLSGARRLVGLQDGRYGFLDLDLNGHARDPVNGSPAAPASGKALALVEWVGIALRPLGRTVRRTDLAPERLAGLGLQAGGYVVLHAGARLAFSRWPHYPALAEALLRDTELTVVLVGGDAQVAAALGPSFRGNSRLRLFEGELPFDDLDALLSHTALFVGNDSGPKHLAALRGAPVVAIHCARNNWSEWGQENGGVIVSRRVPCAGCQIDIHPEECGKAFACVADIAPGEVLSAALTLMRSGQGEPQLSEAAAP